MILRHVQRSIKNKILSFKLFLIRQIFCSDYVYRYFLRVLSHSLQVSVLLGVPKCGTKMYLKKEQEKEIREHLLFLRLHSFLNQH